MMQQFVGTKIPEERESFENLSSKFSELPLYFLSYHGQQSISNVIEAMKEAVVVHGVEHVVIDNLQFMIGVSDSASEGWVEQDKAVANFRRFATNYNCHITLVAHPKKIEGDVLAINSIGGGARVTQEADNILILQVKNSGGKKKKKALQIVKNRYGGVLGFMPLSFHRESNTLSSFFKNETNDKLDNIENTCANRNNKNHNESSHHEDKTKHKLRMNKRLISLMSE